MAQAQLIIGLSGLLLKRRDFVEQFVNLEVQIFYLALKTTFINIKTHYGFAQVRKCKKQFFLLSFISKVDFFIQKLLSRSKILRYFRVRFCSVKKSRLNLGDSHVTAVFLKLSLYLSFYQGRFKRLNSKARLVSYSTGSLQENVLHVFQL